MRRTKILATVGPSCSSEESLRELIAAGVDAFRLNFSHGSAAEKKRLVTIIRQEAERAGRYIPIVGDIQGPKIRIGDIYGTVSLRSGREFTITTEPVIGGEKKVSTPFTELPGEVRPGHRILINDGLVELKVISIDGPEVRTEVVHGGPIGSKKGMNFPDTELTIPAITPKDREDLGFIAEQKLDYVAASFVRRKEDVEEIRAILKSHGADEIEIIAKLEKSQAIDNLDAILDVSDGVMVARGDLGVELPPEAVPLVQKRILRTATERGRFAITATQMLESMTTNSRPTRAEASDVANAIFDGSDAVMLSAETASGAYPVQAVEMMARIALSADNNPQLAVNKGRSADQIGFATDDYTDALAGAAAYAAEHIDAKYLVVFTQSGFTARLISKFRPHVPVIALSRTTWVARRMNLLWGVVPYVLKEVGDYHEEIVECVDEFLLERRLAEKGDRVIILMGSPIYHRATTNLLRVHRVGEAEGSRREGKL